VSVRLNTLPGVTPTLPLRGPASVRLGQAKAPVAALADAFEGAARQARPAAVNTALPTGNLGFEAREISSARAAAPAAVPSYDPAADLFPALDWLNPRTYKPADPNQLSATQPSEVQHVLDAQAGRTPEQTQIALDLAHRGTFSMWMDYADQYAKSHGFLAGAALKAKLALAIGADGAVDGIEKFKAKEPRPFQVDPRVEMLGDVPMGSSYPSGHAASAYAAATVLAEAMPDRAGEFFNAAANVARSRVYLGVHFPGDVAAGAQLGAKVGDVF
jgi:hypothetical protein